MDSIKFGCNYNGKFFNNSFLTIRKSNSIYAVGKSYLIEVKSEKDESGFFTFGGAKIVSKKRILFSELTDFYSYMDMNLPLKDYQDFLVKTYSRFGISIKSQYLDILILKYDNEVGLNL